MSTTIKNNEISKVFAVAPMMDWTDRHCRYFHRLISVKALLYTEMITSAALIRGKAHYLLDYSEAEHPLAVQLGGSDPIELAEAALLCEERGYKEINLNIGCPSDRVKAGCFGAVLMEQPALVASCLKQMRKTVSIDVTVKCRIGIDNQNPDEVLPDFLSKISDVGINKVIIHARKALLGSLSPKQNRDIPPLNYSLVSRMKEEFPMLHISLNGGISSLQLASDLLENDFDGVMIGRSAYTTPWDILSNVDEYIFGDTPRVRSRLDIILSMQAYIKQHLATGGKVNQVTRHMIGLFNGQENSKKWRRFLSDEANLPSANEGILLNAYESMMSRIENERKVYVS
jgi:tRNA-dihydrouridine synthase A|tara:strand:+ start:714 stop:1742 length:1029 start_codon:yes stop_codon:yes gene_type:complete